MNQGKINESIGIFSYPKDLNSHFNLINSICLCKSISTPDCIFYLNYAK